MIKGKWFLSRSKVVFSQPNDHLKASSKKQFKPGMSWIWLVAFLFIPGFVFGQSLKYQFSLKDMAYKDPVHLNYVASDSKQNAYLIFKADTNKSFCSIPGAEDGYAWENAKYLVMEVDHGNAYSAIIHFDFFQQLYDDHPRVIFKTGILPGLRTQVIFPLSYLSAQSIYIPKYPRQLKGTVEGNFLLPSEIAKVMISVKPVQFPEFQPEIRIYNVRLSDELPTQLPFPAKAMVDSLGQWAGKTWPGKTENASELKKAIRRQIQDSYQNPPSTTQFLGNSKIRFLSTGFFRTHFDGKRWWLVDPEGFAFLSSGMDCVRPHSSGPVLGNEDLFSFLPYQDPLYREHFTLSRKQIQYNFLGANLQRAVGSGWNFDWFRFIRKFLLDNQFNTVGNWSDIEFCKTSKMPWVYPMAGFPISEKMVFRDFPDVFDPSFSDSIRKFATQLEAIKTNPFLIGYFLSNEPEWAFGEHNLAAEMLSNPWKSHTRKALINWLNQRYSGDIQVLNKNWEERFYSFQSLDSGSIRIEGIVARKELILFTELLVDSLLTKVCREVKRVDPNHLNLGLRYAWISSDLCYRAATHFDVFSLNGYGMNAPNQTKTIEKRLHKPVLIGEFHIGTLDRGLPASGIAAAVNTEERGWAIRHYLEEAFSRPEIIGVHYFQLLDQPFTGRFDGENYQIGILDICNQPYPHVLAQMKEANSNMYKVARKKKKPFSRPIKSIKPIYY